MYDENDHGARLSEVLRNPRTGGGYVAPWIIRLARTNISNVELVSMVGKGTASAVRPELVRKSNG